MSEPVKHGMTSENLPHWQWQEAQNRSSAVVKAAASSAQLVTVQGQAAAVVLSTQNAERLIPSQAYAQALFEQLACPLLDDEQAQALLGRDLCHNRVQDQRL